MPSVYRTRVSLHLGDGATAEVGVLVQLFEDRVWVCVTEDDNVKPGVVAVGVPDSSRAGLPSGPSAQAMLAAQMDVSHVDADILLSCDEVNVVMGPRDDPLANLLANQLFQVVGAVFRGSRGMVACISLRHTSKLLTTPAAKRGALDGIMNAFTSALCDN